MKASPSLSFEGCPDFQNDSNIILQQCDVVMSLRVLVVVRNGMG